jgi:phosphoribosylaminoimidazolecarboxamide formyltransferase/IMP cyclohydrolase
VGFGNDAYSSYVDCFQCDKESIFGGIVSFNTIVDEKCAKELVKIFLEVVIAHDFTLGALELLKEKKNLRVIKISSKPNCKVEVKSALGGVLVQKKDCNILDDEQLDVVCGSVDDIDIKRLVSLQKVAKYVKSNAIVLGIEDKVVGIAGGQTSRVEALKQAITKMNNRGIKGDVYLASDAFFPFSDSIEIASGCNVKYIIQPGGSIKDDEVIEKCNEKKINMILTGVRHFKH